MIVRRLALLLALALLVPACGDSNDDDAPPPPPPAMLHVFGTGATASGSGTPGAAFGGRGAVLQFLSNGSITAGLIGPSPVPSLPAVPTTGTVLSSLAADYSQPSGNILIPGTVVATGAATRTITAGNGDIVVSGELLSGQNAGSQVNLVLNAGFGTVYIVGAVRTGSTDGVLNGTPSGSLGIAAARIIVTGTIETTGEANATGAGANGGAVGLTTSTTGTDLVVTGQILTSGGSGTGGKGGNAGNVSMIAGTEIRIVGLLRGDGGATTVASAAPTGGNGSFVNLQANAGVFLNGTVEVTGGDTTTTGSGASGGNPGGIIASAGTGRLEVFGSLTIRGGAATAGSGTAGQPIIAGPTTITCIFQSAGGIDLGLLDLHAVGGFSSDTGGQGGAITVSSTSGDVRLSGTVDASCGSGSNTGGVAGGITVTTTSGDILSDAGLIARGGDSAISGGPGGSVQLTAATGAASGGSVWASGRIDTTGGSSTGVGGIGGAGGPVTLESQGPSGRVTLDTGLTLVADGGAASGPATGGSGGTVTAKTVSGVIQIGAQVRSVGGAAPGGTGGTGGRVVVNTDADANGVAGDITLFAGASITVSGGPGSIGGDARRGAVGSKAVEFDADGNNGNAGTAGLVVNFGIIIAEGGRSGGAGGDVLFDGLNQGLTAGPDPGLQSRAGDGAGLPGLFTSQ
jgi:hypothetical protein